MTRANIASTICVVGYNKRVRPPESYTERLKRRQMRAYGHAGERLSGFEEDHLVALELGGTPSVPDNS